jgi:hypothetical protein
MYVFEIIQSVWDILRNYKIEKYRIDIQLHYIHHTIFFYFILLYILQGFQKNMLLHNR